MKKKKLLLIVFAIILLLIVCFFACLKVYRITYSRMVDSITQNVSQNIIDRVESNAKKYEFDYSWSDNQYLIEHAFGDIDGYTYTNSLEAFKYNYELGSRVFEVDFYVTDDYKTVCVHSEDDWREKCGIDDATPFTYDNFMNSKIYDKYTVLDINGLIDLLCEYHDIYIVTDTKYYDEEHVNIQFSQIVNCAKEKDISVLDRIIPQIYNEKMLNYVMNVYDFKSIIYTLYQTNWTPESVALFCRKSGVKYVTMWDSLWTNNILDFFNDFNIKVCIHTVNEVEIVDNFLNFGGAMVYTDSIHPNDLNNND